MLHPWNHFKVRALREWENVVFELPMLLKIYSYLWKNTLR